MFYRKNWYDWFWNQIIISRLIYNTNWFLRWSRKSRKQIPAARALEEDNNVLIIRHANPEDQDIYVCTAENSAGAVHTSAKVQVNCKYLSFFISTSFVFAMNKSPPAHSFILSQLTSFFVLSFLQSFFATLVLYHFCTRNNYINQITSLHPWGTFLCFLWCIVRLRDPILSLC